MNITIEIEQTINLPKRNQSRPISSKAQSTGPVLCAGFISQYLTNIVCTKIILGLTTPFLTRTNSVLCVFLSPQANREIVKGIIFSEHNIFLIFLLSRNILHIDITLICSCSENDEAVPNPLHHMTSATKGGFQQ